MPPCPHAILELVSIGQIEQAGAASRLTLEEWAQLDEDEPGELVEGELVQEEMPTFAHELVVVLLGAVLNAWLLPRGGCAAGSEGKLAVRPRRGRKPDLFAYLPGARRPGLSVSLLRLPPSIVVEVLTPRPRDVRRDRLEKVEDYAAFGVPWYWIMDPELRTLEIWELGPDGRYVHALGAAGGKIEGVPGCPELTIDLDAIWAQLDALGEGDGEG
ncbi:MAG: Uma2 family endonuclease [Deltaproteobacteria bacterium]|nr:Uma2 family endonuclease [Deltaproteobacteria bacterium]